MAFCTADYVKALNQHRTYTTGDPTDTELGYFIDWADAIIRNILNNKGVSYEDTNKVLVYLNALGASYFAEESISQGMETEPVHLKNIRERWDKEIEKLEAHPEIYIGNYDGGVGDYTEDQNISGSDWRPHIKMTSEF